MKDDKLELEELEEKEQKKSIKKVFKEIYFDEFDDPSEEFTDALYDLMFRRVLFRSLKKIKGIKSKHGKFYSVEKIKK